MGIAEDVVTLERAVEEIAAYADQARALRDKGDAALARSRQRIVRSHKALKLLRKRFVGEIEKVYAEKAEKKQIRAWIKTGKIDRKKLEELWSANQEDAGSPKSAKLLKKRLLAVRKDVEKLGKAAQAQVGPAQEALYDRNGALFAAYAIAGSHTNEPSPLISAVRDAESGLTEEDRPRFQPRLSAVRVRASEIGASVDGWGLEALEELGAAAALLEKMGYSLDIPSEANPQQHPILADAGRALHQRMRALPIERPKRKKPAA